MEGEVPDNEGDLAVVGLAELLDERVRGAARLALEVEKLDEGHLSVLSGGQLLAVGSDNPLALGRRRLGGSAPAIVASSQRDRDHCHDGRGHEAEGRS